MMMMMMTMMMMTVKPASVGRHWLSTGNGKEQFSKMDAAVDDDDDDVFAF